MKIGRIAHAGLCLQSERARVLIDPLLTNRFESGFLELEPRISLNQRLFREIKWDAIIITHGHSDHFSVESLFLLDKSIPVFIPAGDLAMGNCLERMGFKSPVLVAPKDRFTINDIAFTATPSHVSFPEMGLHFEINGATAWNMADSVITPEIFRFVRKLGGRLDVLFCPYQPMIENELNVNALGSGFPYERYGGLLKNAAALNPRLVVPTACGLRTTTDWINDRQFPVTEKQFIRDLEKLAPRIKSVTLAPSDVLIVNRRGHRILKQTLPFLKKAGTGRAPRWNPATGVSPLVDTNTLGMNPASLKIHARNYLDHRFFRALGARTLQHELEKLRRHGILWQLDMVYPTGTVESRIVDFSKSSLKWRKPSRDDFPHIHTRAAASALVGLVQGNVSPSAIYHSGLIRQVYRAYTIGGGQVRPLLKDKTVPEPLTTVLYRMGLERNLLLRVDRLVAPKSSPETGPLR